jgi:c-di-GMP-binding flagellar brake protein YcgR
VGKLADQSLSVNQKVIIEFLSPPEVAGSYPSRVDAIGENGIVLYAPLTSTGTVAVPPGTPLTVFFKGSFANYAFESEVIAAAYGNVPLITIKAPLKLTKIQRRDFYRVGTMITVRFRRQQQESDEAYEGLSVDLSGGGVSVNTPVELELEELLDLELLIPKGQPIRVQGKVMRLQPAKPRGLFQAGINFTDITKQDRKRLLDFVVERQYILRDLGDL